MRINVFTSGMLLLLAVALAPVASASQPRGGARSESAPGGIGAFQVAQVTVVRAPRGASAPASASDTGCAMARGARFVYSAPTNDLTAATFQFPASGGSFALVQTVETDGPLSGLALNYALLDVGTGQVHTFRNLCCVDIPDMGEWLVYTTFTYPAVAPGTRVDWADGIPGCQPEPVGLPFRASAPLPFTFIQ